MKLNFVVLLSVLICFVGCVSYSGEVVGWYEVDATVDYTLGGSYYKGVYITDIKKVYRPRRCVVDLRGEGAYGDRYTSVVVDISVFRNISRGDTIYYSRRDVRR